MKCIDLFCILYLLKKFSLIFAILEIIAFVILYCWKFIIRHICTAYCLHDLLTNLINQYHINVMLDYTGKTNTNLESVVVALYWRNIVFTNYCAIWLFTFYHISRSWLSILSLFTAPWSDSRAEIATKSWWHRLW